MRKKTIEDYVELLFNLEQEHSPVHTNDVALALDINPASVTEIFQKLDEEGFIVYKKYAGVTLTKKGRQVAIRTQQKHDVLKQLLMTLGVKESTADHDACHIEHVVHPETIDKLTKFLEFAQLEEGCARWLDHFSYYEKTGKCIHCTPQNEEHCPIHGKQSPKKRNKRNN
jgi:Mn-dependent DtxR family transcriptional regulator